MGNEISTIATIHRTCSDKKKRARSNISFRRHCKEPDISIMPHKQQSPTTPQYVKRSHVRGVRESHENLLSVTPPTASAALTRNAGFIREHLASRSCDDGTSSVDRPSNNTAGTPQTPSHVSLLSPESALFDRRCMYSTDRRRSKSLCTQQMSVADLAALDQLAKSAAPAADGGRKSSNSTVPSLARLRIQQGFKSATPHIGTQILKRTAGSRADVRAFLANLDESTQSQMAKDLFSYISRCVECADNPELIKTASWDFGASHVAMCAAGFKPEFFAVFADAAVAECVRLDGGVHKKCETMLAWSQLFGKMFTGVRDGYYNAVRMQRRSSLPQYRNQLHKQNSFDDPPAARSEVGGEQPVSGGDGAGR